MYVIKRDGAKELVKYDKITNRIRKQTYGLNTDYIDALEVAKKVIQGVHDGVSSVELDNLAAETSASMTSIHPDYSTLAARIAVTSLHKGTKKSFYETIKDLYEYVDPKTGENAGMISDDVFKFIEKNKNIIEETINYDRDFNYDYFGYKTLEKSYLLKTYGKPIERPQHMLMRVACGIWYGNLKEALETYELLSQGLFTHATPTLFNAGTKKPQLSSCFLLMMKDDSLEGIYKTLSDCAMISKNAGGIGIHIHNIRAKGSYIKGTNGTSNGLIPMLRVFNETARYVDQGGGKRKGSIAVYLEPWHADVMDFLDLRKNHGKEEIRARDLFLALWIPDLFMQRVENDADWTLFSPSEAPNLHEKYGQEFEDLYEKYEQEGKGKKVIKAREVWQKILESQIETGTPYMLYKDAANKKNNQKNLGTLHGSNLCVTGDTEVRIRIDHEEMTISMIELHSLVERGAILEILSFNQDKKINEWKYVTASALTSTSAELLEIEDDAGHILRCTPEHKIWTENRGYVAAQDLQETDEIRILDIIEYTNI